MNLKLIKKLKAASQNIRLVYEKTLYFVGVLVN